MVWQLQLTSRPEPAGHQQIATQSSATAASAAATGVMEVRFPVPQSLDNKHQQFTVELLEMCLRITTPSYGPYTLTLLPSMTREREYNELKRGALVTVVDNVASKQWEESFNTVYFPLRRGLHNYYLLMIDSAKPSALLGVNSLEQLKTFRAGVYEHSLTRDIFEANHLNIVIGNDYQGLFQMLDLERFDYLPRPLNRVFGEKNVLQQRNPSLSLHPHLALHITMPTFYYVNKRNFRQQERIEAGLRKLQKQGAFMQLYKKHHNETFYREALRQRTILHLQNPYLYDHPIYRTPELWFNPQQPDA